MKKERGVILLSVLIILFLMTALLMAAFLQVEQARLTEQNIYEAFHQEVILERVREMIEEKTYACVNTCVLEKNHETVMIAREELFPGENSYELQVGRRLLKFYTHDET